MNIEDLLAMEVPTKQLRYICTTNKLKPGGNSKEDFVKCISINPTLESAATSLINEFKYAGRTTVRLYKPLGHLLDPFKNPDYLKNFLISRYGKQIFMDGIRPQLTEVPQLFKAVEYNGKYFLSFVCLGQAHRVLRNYEIVKERPQNVDFLVVHLSPLLLQVRVPKARDQMFKRAFLNSLGIVNNDVDWFNITDISNNQIQLIREKLNSTLICAKHKMTEGIYDTVEVRAMPGVNLANEDKYKNEYDSKPYKSMKIEFPFRHSNGLDEIINIQVTADSVNFYNEVSEEIIQYVVNCFLDVNNVSELVASTKE